MPFVGKHVGAALTGVDAESALVLAPQLSHAEPYYAGWHAQFKDSVFPLRYPEPGCQCAACVCHSNYLKGNIRDTEGFAWPTDIVAERKQHGLPTIAT